MVVQAVTSERHKMEEPFDLPPLKKVANTPEQEPEAREPLVLDMVEVTDILGNQVVKKKTSFFELCNENFEDSHVLEVIKLHNLHLEIASRAPPGEGEFLSRESWRYFSQFTSHQSQLALVEAQRTAQFLEAYFKSPNANIDLLEQVDDFEATWDEETNQFNLNFTHG